MQKIVVNLNNTFYHQSVGYFTGAISLIRPSASQVTRKHYSEKAWACVQNGITQRGRLADVKNPIHDGKRGQLKLPKKSWTVPQCGHVTLNCVQMASKQQNVEFSSHIFQFTRLHGVAVIQGLTFRDSVVTLFKSTRWYVLSGTGFLVAHQLYIGNVMRKYKIGKSSPHQPGENTCHSNVLELSLLWMAWALACF